MRAAQTQCHKVAFYLERSNSNGSVKGYKKDVQADWAFSVLICFKDTGRGSCYKFIKNG